MSRDRVLGWLAMVIWLWLLWGLLTWTATAEQLLYGTAYALLLAVPLSRLGNVGRPWRFLSVRRLTAAAKLGFVYLRKMVAANVSLTRRIWSPGRPLRSAMVRFDDPTHSEGALVALGIISSTVVDNQLVDVLRGQDPSKATQLLYHGVWITSEDPGENARRVTGSMPRLLDRLTGGQ